MNPQPNPGPSIPAVNTFTRRSFMKTSALTVGAVALLSQGKALGAGSGNSSSGGKKTVIKEEVYSVTLAAGFHPTPPPTVDNYKNNTFFNSDSGLVEYQWPENKMPPNPVAELVDTDYIEVPNSYVEISITADTNPSIDDTVPEIITEGDQWRFSWTFNSVVTHTWGPPPQ